jgi:hypothetical protein
MPPATNFDALREPREILDALGAYHGVAANEPRNPLRF